MYIILYILLSILIYVASFKENFTQENLDKVAPLLAVSALLVVIAIALNIATGN